ncbi:centrosomal protein C10orf90 homolog isoform X1 [Neophocaena asiaeorientalis asiaeorientalis]|uniref:Centrosomal protein C10orf90 homolog isoform X1 n=1 Tax=Neophocaena asiaeorientalis asiaeorientalis TaxID=1706337 RepID=A0A341BZ96_NEOAA|nr:centrosomal protein C10orf90 homolog isoform X1 [Neophocaena asiaeorientalis asiaeorientalis]
MQPSGISTKTLQKGYAARHAETAVHRTFQIKTFSTELKNHVMVMDFVKRNWFPSQRRAKVCIIHMYQGLKTAEQTASRYEIHSRLFSSPKDRSAWERNEGLSNAGLRDNQYSPLDHFALKNLQSDVPEKKSDFTEGTLASQNTKMISSIVISQLIDENKSKENGAELPVPCAYPMKLSLANRSGVTINRAFEFLPGRLGIQTPAGERGPATEPPRKEEKPCGGSQKGFASITITARRVGPPASTLVWEAVGDPLCIKCRAQDALLGDPSALAGGADPSRHHGPFTCTEFSRNSSVMGMKVPEGHARLCEGHEYWITNVDSREDHFSPSTPRSQEGKSPLVFSSCVHLRVSQPCPNSVYYLDRSLSVPIEPPRLAGPKVHRSVLSLNLNCSSHRLTPDGVDGTANGEPISSALKLELTEGNQNLLGPRWNLGLQESFLKENPSLGRVHLGTAGTGMCPWRGSPPLENTAAGSNQVTVRKGKEDHAAHCHTGGHGHAKQLSIHIPGWSYTAVETKVFSGSREKQQEGAHVTVSASPVEQKLVEDPLPDGSSSPSNSCQSSDLSEPAESQQQSLPKLSFPLPGSLCPFQDLCTSLQEDHSVQIEREFLEGDYTCCDLVVKIKECKKREQPTTPEPEPVPTEPENPQGPETHDLPEDCSKSQQMPAGSLTLQEALEVRKPQFISRSQERLKKLEHMVQQRKAQQKESLGQKQSLLPVRANKKQFTVPHPLSDNLFKPKERYISEKEMHMRSRRIYNNLPEVRKKKEEQKKRVILQSNRLRAEVFKKQLLDQLLQRNAV